MTSDESGRSGGSRCRTEKSRRTLALPQLCVEALRLHRQRQTREKAGAGRQDGDLVFSTRNDTALDAANVRRSFRQVLKGTDLVPGEWTPQEMRHSFVSLMSAAGVSIEEIARLVGHKSTIVTEKVCRKELRTVLLDGAAAIDRIRGCLVTQFDTQKITKAVPGIRKRPVTC